MTSHMALTLMYEEALQAVNPAVAVPYWDFTLESTFFDSTDFRQSGVFADDWFGAASTGNVRMRDVLVVCSFVAGVGKGWARRGRRGLRRARSSGFVSVFVCVSMKCLVIFSSGR